VQLSTAQHCLSLNDHADQLEPHIDRKGDDQPKRSENAKPRFCGLSILRLANEHETRLNLGRYGHSKVTE